MNRLVSCAALLALTLMLVGCQKTKPPAPPAPTGPAISVKAGDLLKEYSTNAVAADAKYKGKVVQVTGKFGSAQKVPVMGYEVQVLGEDTGDLGLSAVHAFIVESAEADVAKLQQGQNVTIQGTCDGVVLAQVKLSKATVVNK
jgi:hypothetical protein